MLTGGFFLAITQRLMRSRHRDAASLLSVLEIVLALTVVFSPLAWKHGYVLLAPLIVTVAQVRGWKTAMLHSLGLVVLPSLIAAYWGGEIADRSYFTLLGALALIWHASGIRRASRWA